MCPLSKAVSDDVGIRYDWSNGNLKEVENGIPKRAASVSELAGLLGLDATALEQSVAPWNAQCASGADQDFGRPAVTMQPMEKAPSYEAPVFAPVTNTQGGMVHDAQQRVINVFGDPIARPLAAGEVSSSFGHRYVSGGNLTECVVWTYRGSQCGQSLNLGIKLSE